ncbi:unnamed protein product [Leptosia nina]|uniref:Uncharacterized protein n=1 Tax=Leptosia nina TaxID=320188 RepID=A0AAV1J8J3_9NEOP
MLLLILFALPVITTQYSIKVRGKVELADNIPAIWKYIANAVGHVAEGVLPNPNNFHNNDDRNVLDLRDSPGRAGFVHVYGNHDKTREKDSYVNINI